MLKNNCGQCNCFCISGFINAVSVVGRSQRDLLQLECVPLVKIASQAVSASLCSLVITYAALIKPKKF